MPAPARSAVQTKPSQPSCSAIPRALLNIRDPFGKGKRGAIYLTESPLDRQIDLFEAESHRLDELDLISSLLPGSAL